MTEHPDDDGWIPEDPAWQPAETFALRRLELFDEITHPLRGAIVRQLREPKTVAELAELLDAPVTRLYHHINRLVAVGIIRVDATRRAGGAVERRYRAVARRFELDPSLYRGDEIAGLGRAVGRLFDMTKVALQREFELGSFTDVDLDDRAMVTLAELHLTDRGRAELLERLQALIQDVVEGDSTPRPPDARPFRLFVAGFPESR